MMNESKVIREFPIAAWLQGVFVGQVLTVKPFTFLLDKRIGLMVNYAKKEGRLPPAPKLPTSEVIILCVGIFMLSYLPYFCQPLDFQIFSPIH